MAEAELIDARRILPDLPSKDHINGKSHRN